MQEPVGAYRGLAGLARLRMLRVAVAGAFFVAVIVGAKWLLGFLLPTGDSWHAVADAARDVPVKIEPVADPVFALSPRQIRWIAQQVKLPPDGRMTSSLCLHQMHVHGVEAKMEIDGKSVPILEIVLDEALARQYLGRQAAVRTRYGVRFREVLPIGGDHASTSGESHRDQCLGCFAELGIPLSREMIVGGECFALRDVLRDSLAEFSLEQEELAWTALAYALYLPPREVWTNRFGETYRFDDVVDELLRRPLNRTCCCGMHIIHTLTAIARVDAQIPILSDEARSRVRSYLRRLSEAVASRQQPDGSWTFDWHRGLVAHEPVAHVHSGRATPETTLLATGHVAEWMLILPNEMQPPPRVRRDAARWLYARLRESTEQDRLTAFCPYTHAAYAVRQWADVSTGETTGRSETADLRGQPFDPQDTPRAVSFPISHAGIRRN